MSRIIGGGVPFSYRGEVPGDKSISHRAILFGALAEGETVVQGFLPAADPLSTVGILVRLGVGIGRDREALRISGRGRDGFFEPADILDCGNSGTTMRLLAGVLAGESFFSILNGDDSLRRRPMARVVEPLRAMGAEIMGRQDGRFAPLAVRGRHLRPGTVHRLPVASAQVKSALLLAGRNLPGRTEVLEPSPSRDHTERLLRAFGAEIREESLPEGHLVYIDGDRPWQGLRMRIPGDLSSAAFLLALGLGPGGGEVRIERVGLNPTRTGILEVWREMGANLEWEVEGEDAGEPWGHVVARPSELRGLTLDPTLVPRLIDEIPILVVSALWASGETLVTGAGELRGKESDRITELTRELRKLGAEVEELPDGFRIRGGRRLIGAELHSHGDHRLAMSLAVAAATAVGESRLTGEEDVVISFPGFWDIFEGGRQA